MQTNRSAAHQVTLAGLLIALAFALSYLEHLVPLQALVPVPGIKLGFANIVTMFAVIYLNPWTSLTIVVCRCALQALLFGTISGFLFSLSGGICALGIMLLLTRYCGRWLSIFGVSIAGAAAHNLGQILCAMAYFQSASLLSYLPVLLIFSIPMGLFTGLVGRLVFSKLQLKMG